MAECGIILRPLNATGSPYHSIECDQTDFIRKLARLIKQALIYPKNVDQFVKDFIDYLEYDEEEDKVLLKCLQPTRTSSEALEKARGPIQDSVIRMLLQIEDLQTRLISWLLEKLALVSLSDEDVDPADDRMRKSNGKNTKINKPQLILSQLRWLDRIVDGDALTDKFLDILDATSDQVSQEVIACLPEVIAEVSNHEKVATKLRDKLDNNGLFEKGGPMTNVIFDTLTNLTLSPIVATEIQTSVLKTMDSFSLEDRPVLVRFILQSTVGNTEASVVSQLRENLHLEQSNLLTQLSTTQRGRFRTKRPSNSNITGQNAVALIMDIIRISMTKDRKMADAWFRAIEVAGRAFSSTKKDNQLKSLDLFLIVLLHELPNRKRPVESLLKNKIRNGSFNDNLIHKTFSQHKIALAAHFRTLHHLAECLLQCGNEPALVRFSTILHCEMFLNFDRYSQQEIIGDLVTSISSCGNSGSFAGCGDASQGGGGSVRSSALLTLKYLAQNHTTMMSTYSHFVAHILEYLDTMNLSQIRQVMDIISMLSYAVSHKANTVRDDIHIMVRKQLTVGGSSTGSTLRNRIKRMGIIGAVILVKNMSIAAMRDENDRVETSRPSQDTSTGSSTEASEVIKQAIDVLERVKSATHTTGDLAGLFMDELSYVVQEGKVAPQLIEWISKKMAEEFEDIFVDDFSIEDLEEKDDRPNRNFYVPMSIQYNIDGTQDQDSNSEEPVVNIAIDLTKKQATLNGTERWKENNLKLDNLHFSTMVDRFIPHFRLLRVCIANRDNGDLGAVDALLGCPIWLPSEERVLERFDTLSSNERNHVCTMLFSTLNWFRELLNAFTAQFATHQDPEDKKKVLLRLKGIQKVSKDLAKCLRYNLDYIPPKVLHLADTSSWKPLSAILSSKNKGAKNDKGLKKGKGKGLKRKKLADNTNIQTNTIVDDNVTILATLQDKPSQNEIPDEPQSSTSGIDMNHYQPFYRELDIETFDILKYDQISLDDNDNVYDNQNKEVKLSASDLLFLLNDLAAKLDHSLVAAQTKKCPGFGIRSSLKGIGFSRLDSIGPIGIATKSVDLLNYLLTDVEVIAQYFKGILDDTDGIIDFGHGLFDNSNIIVLVKCMERTFIILKSIFAWTGFSSKDQRVLLKQALVRIAERTPNQRWTEHNSILELVEVALKLLAKYSKAVIDVASAAALINLVEAVGQHIVECSQSNQDVEKVLTLRKTIVLEICKEFLQRPWLSPETGLREKGSQYNTHVEAMLNIYLNNHPYEGLGLDGIKNYVGSGVLKEVLKLSTEKSANAKDEENTSSKVYPTFSRSTFLLHYRVLFSHLVTSVKDNVTFGTTKDAMVQLAIWMEAIGYFHGIYSYFILLMNIT